MMMTVMADALVRAGVVPRDRAEEVIKDKLVTEELSQEKMRGVRKAKLRRELKELYADVEAGQGPTLEKLSELSSKYPEVFDEVAHEETIRLRLNGDGK